MEKVARMQKRFWRFLWMTSGLILLTMVIVVPITLNLKLLNNSVMAKATILNDDINDYDEGYPLIWDEKKERMLKTLIQNYYKEHPRKVIMTRKKEDDEQHGLETPFKKKPEIATKGQTPSPQSPQGNHTVYLTIDDGPSSATSKIDKILTQYRVPATFFLLEPNMRKYPNVLKDLAKKGFSLGLHGVTHDKNKFYHSRETVVAEMKTAQKTLQQITGIKTVLIRVPYGSVPYMTPDYRQAEVEAGFIMWDWNVDSLDWEFNDARYVSYTLKQVDQFRHKKESLIILIHDRPETAEYLPRLLEALKARHYEFKAIDPNLKPLQFRWH